MVSHCGLFLYAFISEVVSSLVMPIFATDGRKGSLFNLSIVALEIAL